MDPSPIQQDQIHIAVSLIFTDWKYVVTDRGSDSKRTGCSIALTIGARDCNWNYIGQIRVGVLIHKQTSRRIDRISRRRRSAWGAAVRRPVVGAAVHGTGELVDRDSWIGYYFFAIGGYVAHAVYEPSFLIRIVIPEGKRRVGKSVMGVWIDNSGSPRVFVPAYS